MIVKFTSKYIRWQLVIDHTQEVSQLVKQTVNETNNRERMTYVWLADKNDIWLAGKNDLHLIGRYSVIGK